MYLLTANLSIFLIRETPSKDNYQSGLVQCTPYQIPTGGNAPAAPVLPEPLYLISTVGDVIHFLAMNGGKLAWAKRTKKKDSSPYFCSNFVKVPKPKKNAVKNEASNIQSIAQVPQL